jgi:hypothetical protein
VQGDIADPPASYRGVDRRQRQGMPRRTIRLVELIAVVTGLLVIGVGVPVSLLHVPRSSALDAQAALRDLWAILFFSAGVLHLVRWRMTGDAHAALRGCGTLCFGLLTALTAALAPLLHRSGVDESLMPITRTVAVVACLALLARVGRTPAVDTRVRPLRLLGITVAGAWAFLALAVAAAQSHRPVELGPTVWFAIECGLALGWISCGIRATRRGVTDRSASFTWMGVALLLMSAVEVMRALAFMSHPELLFLGTGVQLVVGAVVLINAATDLAGVLAADGNHLLHMSGTLHETVHHLSTDEQTEAARRHDTRSALASLKAASLVLDRYDATLDPQTKVQLRSSFAQELSRLETMIEGRSREPLEDYRLDAVVSACRGNVDGVTVTGDLAPVRVSGRPEELLPVVRSILAILGRRSPERTVGVRMVGAASGVRLICETRASADTVRDHLSDRNEEPVRRLGLLVARRRMREQGGDLVVHDRADGSTAVELWLRAAAGEAPDQEIVEAVEARLDRADLTTPAEHPPTAPRLTRQHHDEVRPRQLVMADGHVRRAVVIRSYDAEPA